MNTPILIIGFERSGTTLLRRLISMHPHLEFDLLHERRELLKYENPEDAIKNYKMKTKQAGIYLGSIASVESGEKVPYISSKFIKKYISKWKKFWPDSIIFHIIRDCNKCALSANRVFKKDIEQTKKLYIENVPIVIEFLRNYKNVHVIKFERLIGDPKKSLKEIYSVIGYIPDDDCIYKILNTKDPWEYNGKIMCGLRYFQNVGRKH